MLFSVQRNWKLRYHFFYNIITTESDISAVASFVTGFGFMHVW